MLKSPNRDSIPDQVFAQLRDQIVGGDRVAGEALPSERALAETLGINRGAVREALKRLAQARLIAVRQGGPTRVLDYRKHAGIELLSALVVGADGRVDAEVVESIMEMRTTLAPALAAAAAKRITEPDRDRLREALNALKSVKQPVKRAQVSKALWDVLVDASNNIAYRLAFNSLTSTTEQLGDLLGHVLAVEFSQTDVYAALAHAVITGDPEGATAHARTLVETGEQAMGALVSQVASLSLNQTP